MSYDFKKIETKWLYPVLLSILLVEQLPSNKIHSHLVVNPFYKYSTPYPPIQNQQVTDPSIKDLDLINYRVNLPNTVLNIPLYQELYGSSNEILSSIYSIYKIRSYGGHYNVVSNRYGAFLKGIIPNIIQTEINILRKIGVKILTRKNEIHVIGNKKINLNKPWIFKND